MEQLYLLIGLASLLSTVIYVVISRQRRNIVLSRLSFRGRKASEARTPPRSLSPDKKTGPPVANVFDAYPPSCRDTLASLAATYPEPAQKTLLKASPSPEVFAKSQLPMEENYAEADGSKYLPCGFSVDDIKALGDFPDYSALSGVPMPEPYKEFKAETALPRPYRPFRWNYHQTMSLTKMETDWWLEVDSNYKNMIRLRKEIYAKVGGDVLGCLPGSELACKELMEMVLQFMCARYPQHFSLSADKKIFHNGLLGVDAEIRAKPPLEILLDHIPEDFGIMLRNPKDGYYYLRAGVICSALGWNVGMKIGMQLHQIHQPIPDYKEKMQFSMDRFFSKMPTNKPIQRGSWGLEVDTPLYMPPGDPHEKYRESQAEDVTLDRCNLRVDWQTLRRLPLSSAIVFNFKGLFTPVSEFRDESHIPALVLKVLNEGKKNLMEYKNTWHVEHVVKPNLEKWAKEQEESGLVEKGWEVHTLDESPWFPGWQEKWHRQQGF